VLSLMLGGARGAGRPHLDSEQFRSAPKTVGTSIGKLEVRQTD